MLVIKAYVSSWPLPHKPKNRLFYHYTYSRNPKRFTSEKWHLSKESAVYTQASDPEELPNSFIRNIVEVYCDRQELQNWFTTNCPEVFWHLRYVAAAAKYSIKVE